MTLKPIIRRNVIDTLNTVILSMDQLKIQLGDDKNKVNVERFQDLSILYETRKDKHVLREIKRLMIILLNDKGILDCISRSHEYYLPDSADFFLARVSSGF